MNFQELIQTRSSVRAYRDTPVPDELLQQVLEAARLAPTAASRQPIQLLVVHTADKQAELGKLYSRKWFLQAPLLIGVCAVPGEGWVRGSDGKNYAEVDAAIVMDHVILAAADAGLGTCWIAAFDPQAARTIFNLPAGVEPIAFTPLGYAADAPGPGTKQRKPLQELVHYERW